MRRAGPPPRRRRRLSTRSRGFTLRGARSPRRGSNTMDMRMVRFMEASGFEVVNSEVAGYVAGVELGRTGPEAACELGRRADRPDAAGGIMPGGHWPAMRRLEG